ncbi:glycosyltransferase family 2 protein [Chloroflexota bacterium]
MVLKPERDHQETNLLVIVGIPCFNNAKYIENVILGVKKYVDRVVIIDDGSKDRTSEIAEAAGALVVKHSVNKGYGEAIKSCFEMATVNNADILVILDGDGQHDPENIPQVLEPVLRGIADIVIGSRFLTEIVNMPRYRRFGIKVISFLFNLGLRNKISDVQSGFRVYHRKFFSNLRLTERGMSISIEILEKARKKHMVVAEVPVICYYFHSKISLRAIKHGLSIILTIIKIRLINLFRITSS